MERPGDLAVHDDDLALNARDLRVRLRVAALLALAAGMVFLELELRHSGRPVTAGLWFGWGIHTGIATLALIASYSALSARAIDRLVPFLVVGHMAIALNYLHGSPFQPGIAAAGLICLLMVSAIFFSWSRRRMLAISALACLGFALVWRTASGREPEDGAFVLAFGALAVGAAVAIACTHMLAMLRARLARRQRELANLSARLMSLQEEERRRLSRELHDEFGQSLTAVNTYLWLVERQLPGELTTLRTHTSEARRLVGKTLAAMRELSQLLRPAVLDEFGLLPSLDGHLKSFARRHRIAVNLTAEGLPERLPPEMETALYRIIQEALTNVVRHARATSVRVALTAGAGVLRLEIADDGVGFPASNGDGEWGGTGLIGIRERAHALGGSVMLDSERGARLHIGLPLPPETTAPGSAGAPAPSLAPTINYSPEET